MKDLALIWRGNIENGKLILSEPDYFRKYLCSLRGEVEIIVRKWKRRRTDNQNNYYWAVVIPILSESLGYSDDEMHEALKWKFLRNREREKLATVKSTASLSTIEFKNYIDEIVKWAAEEQIIIPEPEKIEVQENIKRQYMKTKFNSYLMARNFDELILRYKNLGWIAKLFLSKKIKNENHSLLRKGQCQNCHEKE